MYQSIVEVTDVATGDTVIHWESGGSLLAGLDSTRLIRSPMRTGAAVITRTVVIREPEILAPREDAL